MTSIPVLQAAGSHSAPAAIGFIGFGEASYHIAKGLREAGAVIRAAYDQQPAPRLRQRAADTGVRLVESIADLTRETDIVFSAVVPSAAGRVANAAAASLGPRHVYVDINTVSPATKQTIDRIVSATGARFVEAAVMAAVPPHGHRVPMLLAGSGAPALIELLTPYGMRLELLGDRVGGPSAVKMCRSILIKGLEALMLECLAAAAPLEQPNEMAARIFASMNDSFPGLDWNSVARYLVGRTVRHGERRAHEMREAAETLRSLGIDPIMADAAARRLAWCADLRLAERLGDAPPDDYRSVMRALSGEINR